MQKWWAWLKEKKSAWKMSRCFTFPAPANIPRQVPSQIISLPLSLVAFLNLVEKRKDGPTSWRSGHKWLIGAQVSCHCSSPFSPLCINNKVKGEVSIPWVMFLSLHVYCDFFAYGQTSQANSTFHFMEMHYKYQWKATLAGENWQV